MYFLREQKQNKRTTAVRRPRALRPRNRNDENVKLFRKSNIFSTLGRVCIKFSMKPTPRYGGVDDSVGGVFLSVHAQSYFKSSLLNHRYPSIGGRCVEIILDYQSSGPILHRTDTDMTVQVCTFADSVENLI